MAEVHSCSGQKKRKGQMVVVPSFRLQGAVQLVIAHLEVESIVVEREMECTYWTVGLRQEGHCMAMDLEQLLEVEYFVRSVEQAIPLEASRY